MDYRFNQPIRAVQADITTPLKTIGEVKNVSLTRGSYTFNLDALVIKGDLGSDIVAGEPFLEFNDIAIRSAKKHIIIKGKDVVPYASTPTSKHPTTRRIQTYVCRPEISETIFPGESAVINGPSCLDEETVVLEPRTCSKTYDSFTWPEPQFTVVKDGKIHWAKNAISKLWKTVEMLGTMMEIWNFQYYPQRT